MGAYYSFKSSTVWTDFTFVLGIILSIGACIGAVLSIGGMTAVACNKYNPPLYLKTQS